MPRAPTFVLSIAAMLAACAVETSAQDFATAFSTPRLKPQVVVASDLVRVGDLVENAGALAATPVFRAPDLGQTGAVQTRRVLDALMSHGMTLLDAGDIAAVTVIRSSRAFTRLEIEQCVARALAGQPGLGAAKDLSIAFDREVRTLHVEPSLDSELEVARVHYDPRSGRFDLTLELPGSPAARRTPLRYTGTVVETAPAVVLNRPLVRGDVVAETDFAVERRPKAALGADAVPDADRALGMAARRALRAGDILRAADLMKPEIVQRNEPVLIVFDGPGFVITVRGKALDSGAEGDMVKVVNTQSKRPLQGLVTAPGRVSLVSPSYLAAAGVLPAPSRSARN